MEDRLAALEQRVRLLEDTLAITQLVASYGPLVDAGDAESVAALWTVDGVYDVEGWDMRGRDDLRAMVLSEGHQHLITGGCAHFLGPAQVVVDGDRAVAVCESILVRHRDGGYSVRRAGANHFDLVRESDGWRIAHRVTRALNGATEARDLLTTTKGQRP
jgi:uncharacterized protein (TIGR02246 family)